MNSPDTFSPIRWAEDHLQLLDQTRLPTEEVWLACRTPEDVAGAIRRLSVRGAPAIGVSAAYALVLGVPEGAVENLEGEMLQVIELIGATRPTAVNLRWALKQGDAIVADHVKIGAAPELLKAALLDWANRLHAEDIAANRRIGEHGARLFVAGDNVLTHCNTGALATAGYGTALGVIQAAWTAGRLASVWVDETRPLLQGARLTAWELGRLGIPYRLVTDSSAGALMSRGLVDRVVVGADRIAANGDTANKIGTYSVAVLAQRHGVPFYVAAPLSTIDPDTLSGADIPIEERNAEEVRRVFGTAIAPDEAEAMNFAFDVTPAELITAIITDAGVLKAPYDESIRAALVGR